MTPHSSIRAGYIYVLIFVLLAVSIVVSGYLYYHNFEQHFRLQAENQISTVANLKAQELADWRKERLGDDRPRQDSGYPRRKHVGGAVHRKWNDEGSMVLESSDRAGDRQPRLDQRIDAPAQRGRRQDLEAGEPLQRGRLR